MRRQQRRLLGILTTPMWLGFGGYVLAVQPSMVWKIVGALALAIGLFRAVLLVWDWNKGS